MLEKDGGEKAGGSRRESNCDHEHSLGVASAGLENSQVVYPIVYPRFIQLVMPYTA